MTENKKLLMDLTEIEQLHVKQYLYKFVATDITEDIRKCRKACKIVKEHQGGKTGLNRPGIVGGPNS